MVNDHLLKLLQKQSFILLGTVLHGKGWTVVPNQCFTNGGFSTAFPAAVNALPAGSLARS